MRRLFTFEGRVDRATYARTGAALMALKVGVDLAVYRAAVGEWAWPPFAFDLGALFRSDVLSTGPGFAAFVIVAWSVPFIWIGTAMSSRRADDAGVGRGWAALFVVPFVNWLLILALALLPTRVRDAETPPPLPDHARPVHGLVAGSISVVVALLVVALCVYGLGSYGGALFVGTPFLFGTLCAWIANLGAPRTLRSTLGVVNLSFTACGVALVFASMEGAICILMAAPIGFALANFGALLGWSIRDSVRQLGTTCAVLPALLAADAIAPPPKPHEVASSIDVDAPPEAVWRHVVGFSTIPDEPEGLFRLGLACPMRATIDGAGVGAVRRCEFTTGAFVEPITAWDEPRRLAFDVAEHPPPMIELSPYSTVHAPHLDGYFRSVRGEFRLVALPGGRTRLEGSTWYLLDMGPRAYWDLWADALVHRIHLRVLRHVKRLAEEDR
jgi:uncharacterized membrane protein YhaH (DUF805 family)